MLALFLGFVLLVTCGLISTIQIAKSVREMNAYTASHQADYFPPYPVIAASKKTALVKRGEYVIKSGDCLACHTDTDHKGPLFGGGLAMPTPFGVLYTPNITPDKKTGIGNWQYKDFKRAMRDGVNPHGQFYYPALPYPYFTHMSDDELKAAWAYLRAIPAVHKDKVPDRMAFPFNFRVFQLGWRILFFDFNKNGALADDKTKSKRWNRGRYIVRGPGHCEMCHSPSYYILNKTFVLGAPIKKYDLTGQKIQGYLAPNITSTNLGDVPAERITRVFTHDTMTTNAKVAGPMLEVNHDSLKYLTQEDLLSIATYLKSVKSQIPPVPKSGIPGKGLYESTCSGCHETGSGGAPKYGDATDWDPYIKKGMKTMDYNALHGFKGMPAKGTCSTCSVKDIEDAVAYMANSVKGKKAGPAPKPQAKPLTMADGQHIYAHHCAACHNPGRAGAPRIGNKAAWAPIVKAGLPLAFERTMHGYKGHPAMGGCTQCSGEEIKAALKYMMQRSSNKNFSLW
ncbi:MAG: cytochrome c [marine bacterium B5-7]|nr:MAG: cytochrome c [marine bacterium B5-7]